MKESLFNTEIFYVVDLKLATELGLIGKQRKVKEDENWKTIPLGTVKFDTATVEIFVQCCPAHFYTFKIKSEETGKEYTYSTGSGALVDFWPSIKLIADSMLVCGEIK